MNAIARRRLAHIYMESDPLTYTPLHRTAWWVVNRCPVLTTVFGGYVRDVLVGDSPNDIDVRIPFNAQIGDFCDALGQWAATVDPSATVTATVRPRRAAALIEVAMAGATVRVDVVHSGMCSEYPSCDANNVSIRNRAVREIVPSPNGLDGCIANILQRRYVRYDGCGNENGMARLRARGWVEIPRGDVLPGGRRQFDVHEVCELVSGPAESSQELLPTPVDVSLRQTS